MKTFEKKGQITETVFFPEKAIQFSGKEPEVYISRLGEARGNGSYQATFLHPYSWGMIALSGEARMTQDGKEIHLVKGDFFLFRAGREALFSESVEKPFQYLWFDLMGSMIEDHLDLIVTEENHYARLSSTCLKNLQKLARDYAENIYTPAQSISVTWNFFHYLQRSQEEGSRVRDVAHSCRMILDTEFASAVNVNDVAKHLNVDRSTLYRRFKKSFGESPKQYLDRLKVEYSHQLLQTTHLPIKEIAFESGYESLQHFYLMYGNHYGHSPGEVRS